MLIFWAATISLHLCRTPSLLLWGAHWRLGMRSLTRPMIYFQIAYQQNTHARPHTHTCTHTCRYNKSWEAAWLTPQSHKGSGVGITRPLRFWGHRACASTRRGGCSTQPGCWTRSRIEVCSLDRVRRRVSEPGHPGAARVRVPLQTQIKLNAYILKAWHSYLLLPPGSWTLATSLNPPDKSLEGNR